MPRDPHADELRLPPGPLRLRRPTTDDVAGVAALHAAAERARTGLVRTRPEDVRVRWLALDALTDVVLVEHRDAPGGLIGVGEYTVELDLLGDALVLHVEGQVHPDWTGHGVATTVLGRGEGRARSAAADAEADTVRLRTTVTDGDDRARAWFTARGFVPVRNLVTMRLELDAPPATPALPDAVRLRTFRRGRDERRAWAAHEASFADVATHLPLAFDEWVEDRILRDPAFEPTFTFLAVDPDGEVIGLTVCRAGVDGAPEDGFVRDLGVVPAWRGRGIGMALLVTALRAFRRHGLTGASLDVDDVTIGAAVRLYERAGMRIVHRVDVLERTLAATTPVASPAPG